MVEVPWLISQAMWCDAFEGALSLDGIEIKKFQQVGSALEEFLNTEYPIIVTDLRFVKGVDHKDEHVKELMAEGQNSYYKVGLYVIEKIRSQGSANRDTPIVVTDTSPRSNVPKDIEELCRQAGANEYIGLLDLTPSKVAKAIKPYLK